MILLIFGSRSMPADYYVSATGELFFGVVAELFSKLLSEQVLPLVSSAVVFDDFKVLGEGLEVIIDSPFVQWNMEGQFALSQMIPGFDARRQELTSLPSHFHKPQYVYHPPLWRQL